ncbi:MAG: ABC transporter permease [Polyangiaceae bacterium]
MSHILLIAGREMRAYFRSPLGWVAASAALFIDGVWFIAKALGDPGAKRLSATVLNQFFNGITGVTMIIAIALSMRLIAQEEEQGTLVLLKTSPMRDWDLVLGKFLAVFGMIAIITGLTVYMPALIFVNGKVSVGHIATGYLGVLLLGAATASVGIFASALAKRQVVAAILGAVIMGALVLLWLLAKMTEPPVTDFLNGLAIHHLRQRDFMTGVLRLENVVYYLVVCFFFLLATTKTLEARRWQ